MSEHSDHPDSPNPNEPFPAGEPFDPKEHFKPPESGEPAPLESEDLETGYSPPPPSYVPAPASVSSAKLVQPSYARGIGAGLLGGALIVGLAIGIAYVSGSRFTPPPAAEPASTTTTSTEDPKAPAPSTEGSKVDTGDLVRRLDEIEKRIASMPKPEPIPDIKSLEAKVEGVAKRVETLPTPTPDTKAIEDKIEKASTGQADLLAKLNAVTAQIDKLEKDLAAENSTVAELQTKIKTLSEGKTKPESTPAANGANPNAETDAELAKAVESFKKLQFSQANDLFAKLQESLPNDARVWYYSAMANGFATNQWRGETERRVKKGMELEKAGTPDTAKINETFADLPTSAKGWLDAYRAQINR